MRYVSLLCFLMLNIYQPANAHSMSDFRWELTEYDQEALMNCAEAAETSNCMARLYPCEAAFDLSVDANLADLPDGIRHDLTACFMAYRDVYEIELWAIKPQTNPDPMIARNANPLFNNVMFKHHRNAPGECVSQQEEKTEDWRCALRQVQTDLINAMREDE